MLTLWYLKSFLEIVFFSSVIYCFSIWLKKDKRHNLLLHFYMYCGLFCMASLLNLATIVAFLIYAAPFTLLLFVVFHQEILQRNFITLRQSSISYTDENSDWVEQLLRASLQTINNKKQLLCVIEHRSDLKPFISIPVTLHSPLSSNLLTLLIDSTGFDNNKMILCSSQGKIIGLNTSWNILNDATWHSQAISDLDAWQQDALLMTLKTDTIVFRANPTTRAFDIVVKGAINSNLPAHQALMIIKKHLTISTKGEFSNERIDQKRTVEQQNT